MAPASNESLCVMVLRSMMNVPRKTDSGSAGTLAWEGISRSIARQWCGQSRRSISRRDCFSTPIGRRAMPQKIHHETAHCFLVTRWPKKTPQIAQRVGGFFRKVAGTLRVPSADLRLPKHGLGIVTALGECLLHWRCSTIDYD